MTKNINQTNQLNNYQEREMFYPNSYLPTQNKSRGWKYAKPNLLVNCSLCDSEFTVKYILPKKQYSQKNNWGYWTGKKAFQNKYVCDNCLVDIHQGGIINWVDKLEKADIFYTYLSRRTIRKN